jgi:hypothetical protein
MNKNNTPEKRESFRVGVRWLFGQRTFVLHSPFVIKFAKTNKIKVSKTRGCNPLESKQWVQLETFYKPTTKLSLSLFYSANLIPYCGAKGLQPLVTVTSPFVYRQKVIL